MQSEVSEITEQEAEAHLLRRVFESARRFLRFNGVDALKMRQAVLSLDMACEQVKLFDGGLMDEDDFARLLRGTGSISHVARILDAYECGQLHGLQVDGDDNAQNGKYDDPRYNDAYRIGYKKGAHLAHKQGSITPGAVLNAANGARVARTLLREA